MIIYRPCQTTTACWRVLIWRALRSICLVLPQIANTIHIAWPRVSKTLTLRFMRPLLYMLNRSVFQDLVTFFRIYRQETFYCWLNRERNAGLGVGTILKNTHLEVTATDIEDFVFAITRDSDEIIFLIRSAAVLLLYGRPGLPFSRQWTFDLISVCYQTIFAIPVSDPLTDAHIEKRQRT